MNNSPAQQHDAEHRALEADERRVLIACQAGLPLSIRPYHELADRLGMPAGELMAHLRSLQERGIIRRIAAVPNHYRLGYKANGMTVWDVADEQVRELGQRIGKLSFVSHCYRRPRHLPVWPYNLFAMVHGHDREEVAQQVQLIQDRLGEACRAHEVLFSTRILKKTGLRMRPEPDKD